MKTGCVILAGGQSSRMGSDKAMLSIGHITFIEKISETFSFCEEKMIATGNPNVLTDRTWILISDVYSEHGPIGGIHAALSCCQSETMFFVACDMPFIKAAIYHRLQSEMTDDVDAVVAVTEDGKYQPLCGIYRKTVGKTAQEQIVCENNKIMELLKRIRTKYVNVNSKTYGLYNINTQKEYEHYINK